MSNTNEPYVKVMFYPTSPMGMVRAVTIRPNDPDVEDSVNSVTCFPNDPAAGTLFAAAADQPGEPVITKARVNPDGECPGWNDFVRQVRQYLKPYDAHAAAADRAMPDATSVKKPGRAIRDALYDLETTLETWAGGQKPHDGDLVERMGTVRDARRELEYLTGEAPSGRVPYRLYDFRQTDWYGYAGAEPAPAGRQPKIAYCPDAPVGDYGPAWVVVDANGVTVDVPGDGPQDMVVYSKATSDRPGGHGTDATYDLAEVIARHILSRGGDQDGYLTHHYLTAAGFEEVA